VTWLATALVPAAAPPVSPVDATTGSLTGYILGFGPVGITALALAWLLFRGWRLVQPGYDDQVRVSGRNESRADLLEENRRLIAEKTRAEEQRDEALKIAQTQLVPMLVQFNATVSALIPLLQDLVARREGHERGTRRP